MYFRFFIFWKVKRMTPFCNLFMERLSYKLSVRQNETQLRTKSGQVYGLQSASLRRRTCSLLYCDWLSPNSITPTSQNLTATRYGEVGDVGDLSRMSWEIGVMEFGLYQAKLVGVVVPCHLQDDDVTELRHQLLVPLRLRQDITAAADWVMRDNDYLHDTTTLNFVPTCDRSWLAEV